VTGRLSSRNRTKVAIRLRVVRFAIHGREGRQLRRSKRISILTSTTRLEGRLISHAKERTELILGEGAKRLRAVRVSRHGPKSENRQLPDNRMLWKWNALMPIAPYPIKNSVLSNAGDLRRQSRNVVGFSMENRTTMTWRDGGPKFPHSNERCKLTQCGKPRTPPARGPAVAELKCGSPTHIQRHCVTGSDFTR
jgi:hypothetical protein